MHMIYGEQQNWGLSRGVKSVFRGHLAIINIMGS